MSATVADPPSAAAAPAEAADITRRVQRLAAQAAARRTELPHPPEPLHLRVRGQLAERARLAVATDGSVHLYLVLSQPQGVPVLIDHDYGRDPTAYRTASAKAWHLQRGALVTAHGRLLAPTTLNGAPALTLRCVDAVHIDRLPD